MTKIHTLTIRNRAVAVLIGVGVLAIGALLLMMGFALLLGLGIAGTLVGAGVAGYRRLRGTSGAHPRLDPAREVKPVIKAIVRPLDEND